MDIVENYLGDTLFSRKLSSSISYYLWFCFDETQSDEALLNAYLDASIPYDDAICSHIYLERVARKRIQMQEQ